MLKREMLIGELKFCLELWERRAFCKFGGHTNCEQCASPYLLWKLITGEGIHGDNLKRLTLEEWKEKLASLKSE
jgi:hypothetical protein